MPKRKRRPALTKKQKQEYAKVPISKDDEKKLVSFLKGTPPGPYVKKDGEEE